MEIERLLGQEDINPGMALRLIGIDDRHAFKPSDLSQRLV